MESCELPAVDPHSDVCQMLSCLPEKFVVDFANGIDIVRDHVRVQQDRTGFFSRLYDGFTGQGSRRQAAVNANLAAGVEGALLWLTELTGSVARSNLALSRVNERLASMQDAVIRLAHHSADTRSQIEDLSRSLHARLDGVSEALTRLAAEHGAAQQVDWVFNKWAAGRFAPLSCVGRCYAVLEELRWGAFGDLCRTGGDPMLRQRLLDDLANRAVKQLAADQGLAGMQDRSPIHTWLAPPGGTAAMPDADEALAYLGNWATPDMHPFVFSSSQRPDSLPVALPRICSPVRVAEALVSEVFEEAR